MVWDVLNIVGTRAFVISGAIIAIEEDYDILGAYVLGFITAFGGGTIRNLLIGIPIQEIWQQGNFFIVAFIAITLVFLLPNDWLQYWNKWGILMQWDWRHLPFKEL
ncbi:YvgT [Bacillus freudenreichii]|nr:YvgT [Bacillus freudenreichii]